MLAGHLITIASIVVDEYSSFELIQLMQEAASISSSRPQMQESQYRQHASKIRMRAESVIQNSIITLLPNEISNPLLESDLSAFLPHRIASMLTSGLPDTKEAAISSGEINMYVSGAQNFIHSLNSLISTAKKLKINEYKLDDDKLGINIVIPREIVDNRIIALSNKIKFFTEWAKTIDEIASGSSRDPEILYISTTDPLVALVFLPPSSIAILHCYKLLLEIAEKHINIIKSIRDLRKSGAPQIDLKDFEEKTQEMIDASVASAVNDLVTHINTQLDEARTNELRSALTKKSIQVVTDIAMGARISISIESQNKISETPSLDGSDGLLRESLEQQKKIEHRIDDIKLTMMDTVQLPKRPDIV